MHVAMTYPADTALRGGDWAAAARCGGVDVTEIVLADRLSSPPLPTIPWMAQTSSRRYVIESAKGRTKRRRVKKLAHRTATAIDVVAGHHGAVDVLHTHSPLGADFAARLDTLVAAPRFHTCDARDATAWRDAGLEHAGLIRTWRGDSIGEALPDAYRSRVRIIPTPLDFSVEGATPQLTKISDRTPVESPGQPWLAALSPLRIMWRGDLVSPEAEAMVDAFAALRFTGTRLEMVGDNLAGSQLVATGHRLGLDGRLVGRPTGTPQQMAELIAQADILVVGDTHPILEREAMSALILGTPVVAPPTPVYRELIDRSCGAVIDPADAAGLAAAIRATALVDVHDPLTMSARAGRHTFAAVGGRLADAYHELVTGELRPRPAIHIVDGDRQIAS